METLSRYIVIDTTFTSEILDNLTELFREKGIRISSWCKLLPKISLVDGKPDYDYLLVVLRNRVFPLTDQYLDESFKEYGFILNDDTRNLFRKKLLTMCGYRMDPAWCNEMPRYLKESCVVSEVRKKEIHLICWYFQNYLNYDPDDGWYRFDAYSNCMSNFRSHYMTLFDLCFYELTNDDGLEGLNWIHKCPKCDSFASRVDEDGICFYGCYYGELVDDFIECADCCCDTANWENGINVCIDCEISQLRRLL